MANEWIEFHVLDVGQGACNYVEFHGAGNVVHNMLIDLGTNSSQAIAATNLQWLRDKIAANKRYLDVLILTHGDTDHYNMIAKILPAFGEPNHEQIGMTRFGGPAWRYGKLINKLSDYTQLIDDQPDIATFPEAESSFRPGADPQWEPIWAVGDDDDGPKLQLIIANTAHPNDSTLLGPWKKANAEAINTKSVVLGLEWKGYWFITTGDATSTTIGAVNHILGNINVGTLPKTFMLTLPHHGARRTTYDLKNANDIPEDTARQTVDTFLTTFAPEAISVSAAEKTHHHPSMYMIRQFVDKLSYQDYFWQDPVLNDGTHFLTSWVDLAITRDDSNQRWPLVWEYATTTTESNVYSTYYFKDAQYHQANYAQYLAPPIPVANQLPVRRDILGVPMGRNWEFRIEDHGGDVALSVNSRENAARANAARADFAAMAKAPPPSSTTPPGRFARANLIASVVTPSREDAPLRPLDHNAPSLRGLRATE